MSYANSYMARKQRRTPYCAVNQMDPFKCTNSKDKLSHGDIAKIVRILGGARYVFALKGGKTDMTEIRLIRKTIEVLPQLENFAANLKAQGNPMQRFRSDIEYYLRVPERYMMVEKTSNRQILSPS